MKFSFPPQCKHLSGFYSRGKVVHILLWSIVRVLHATSYVVGEERDLWGSKKDQSYFWGKWLVARLIN